jgi:hypothetical protein
MYVIVLEHKTLDEFRLFDYFCQEIALVVAEPIEAQVHLYRALGLDHLGGELFAQTVLDLPSCQVHHRLPSAV